MPNSTKPFESIQNIKPIFYPAFPTLFPDKYSNSHILSTTNISRQDFNNFPLVPTGHFLTYCSVSPWKRPQRAAVKGHPGGWKGSSTERPFRRGFWRGTGRRKECGWILFLGFAFGSRLRAPICSEFVIRRLNSSRIPRFRSILHRIVIVGFSRNFDNIHSISQNP